jgi:hypothetical protein
MSGKAAKEKRRGPVALGELVNRVIDPVTARRGIATADLIAAWPEIAGPLHAGWTAPEKIVWPRQTDGDETPAGLLFIKADGPRAILVQHELPQIIERVNAFFGYRAIAQARIVQGPVGRASPAESAVTPPLDEDAAREVAEKVAGVDDDRLREALERLGREVRASRRE